MKLNLEMKIVGLVVITMIIGSLCIGIMAVTFARSDVSGIIDTYSNTTISFIQHAIEETMMTGNTEVTRNLTRKKGSALGVESIMVLDAEGREAFSQTKTKVPSNEMEIIDRVKLNKNTFTEEGADSIVYYVPIINAERCTKCHSGQDQLRGILKVSMSIKDAKSRINDRLKTIIISMLFAVLIFGAVLLMIFKRSVIGPIKDLEHASKSLSQGDLSFKTNIASEDEIGFLNKHLKESIDNVSKIIHKY
ncbi:MAG: HAMP domain-containing protein [Nitrospirae bacterium]|nr:HAMP domain-containing protein [Nitrospirota bacterium]